MKNFYSYSKISCFENCPLQYDLLYRRQIKLPRSYSFDTMKGNIFHRYAEVYKGDRRAALDVVFTPRDEGGITKEFLDRMTTEEKQRAIDYTKMYDPLYDLFLAKKYEITHEVKLFGDEIYLHKEGAFAFTGYIDVLIKDGDTYTILDFKTAKSANPSLYKSQILIYAHFLSCLHNIPLSAIQGAIYFPCVEDLTFEERWKPVKITEKAVLENLEKFHTTIEAIEAEVPNKDPNLQFLCKWCNFAAEKDEKDEPYCVTSVIAGLRKT